MRKNNVITAVIPASGIGTRMGADVPKQYLTINHLTILEHTINKLLQIKRIEKIIVVINKQDTLFANLKYAKNPKISTTYGGDLRSDSVLAGLKLINDNHWALVHDAVRPCVSADEINQLIDAVLTHKQGAILATKITDTIKQSEKKTEFQCIEKTIDRQYLWAAATPQMFNAKKLKKAIIFARKEGFNITDEASAIELKGENPLLIECSRSNIKITQKEDLLIATTYLNQSA